MNNHFHFLIKIKEEKEIGFYKFLNADRSVDAVRFKNEKWQTTSISPNLSASEGPDSVVEKSNLSASERPDSVVEKSNLSASEGPDSVVEKSNLPASEGPDSVVEKSNLPASEGPDSVVEKSNLSASEGPDSVIPSSNSKKPNPALHFSHLFNAYAKYFNLQNQRTGALFERPFQRIKINSLEYLRRLVVYIHKNPQNHGFVNDFKEYRWSSYKTILGQEPTKTEREKVIAWFDDRKNFIYMHHSGHETEMAQDIGLDE